MPSAAEILAFLERLTPTEIAAGAVVLLAIFYFRRAGVVLSQLGLENRKLRRGIQGYERLEQQHFDLSQENRERNQFHGALQGLISRLQEERTVAEIVHELVDFTARMLGASETMFLAADGGALGVRE